MGKKECVFGKEGVSSEAFPQLVPCREFSGMKARTNQATILANMDISYSTGALRQNLEDTNLGREPTYTDTPMYHKPKTMS